jgi:DNA polymerase I-like protein with 3'-5' exonuclease and polymerase domains
MISTPTRLDAVQLLISGIQAFARAEQQGIRIDTQYCLRKQKQLDKRVESLEKEFKATKFYHHWHKSVGGKTLNIDSNAQLSRFLYKVKKIEPSKLTTGGDGSTDEEALTQLNIPEVQSLLTIRKLKKLKTYLEQYEREQVDGVVHPFLNLHTVKSIRSSSDHPNAQNIPNRDEEAMRIVRRALFPRLGHQFLEIDFKGSEVISNACINKDPNLLKYVRDPTTDMHRDMAIEIFKLKELDKKNPEHYLLRQAGKNGFVFPEFYGDYYVSCAENCACNWGKLSKGVWHAGEGVPLNGKFLSDHLIANGITSLIKFIDHVKKVEHNFWFKRFRVYQRWKDVWFSNYQKNGYFDMPTGFRCSGVMSKKEVGNYPGQGSAFHCLLYCFIRIDHLIKKEKLKSHLVNQVHDSMLLDVYPPELEYLSKMIKRVIEVELAEYWDWLIVPMSASFEICEIDKPWSEKREYAIAA